MKTLCNLEKYPAIKANNFRAQETVSHVHYLIEQATEWQTCASLCKHPANVAEARGKMRDLIREARFCLIEGY